MSPSVIFNREITSQRSAAEVLDLLHANAAKADIVHFVTAVHRVARHGDGMSLRRDPKLLWVAGTLEAQIQEMNARHLANTSWAFAKLNIFDAPLRNSIA